MAYSSLRMLTIFIIIKFMVLAMTIAYFGVTVDIDYSDSQLEQMNDIAYTIESEYPEVNQESSTQVLEQNFGNIRELQEIGIWSILRDGIGLPSIVGITNEDKVERALYIAVTTVQAMLTIFGGILLIQLLRGKTD